MRGEGRQRGPGVVARAGAEEREGEGGGGGRRGGEEKMPASISTFAPDLFMLTLV